MGLAHVCECSHYKSDHPSYYKKGGHQHTRCNVLGCECKEFKLDHLKNVSPRGIDLPSMVKDSSYGRIRTDAYKRKEKKGPIIYMKDLLPDGSIPKNLREGNRNKNWTYK